MWGSNYYGSFERVMHWGTYARREAALAAAFALAKREHAAEKEDLFRCLPAPSSPRYARKRANAEELASTYYKELVENEDGWYTWGMDTDTGPGGSVCVEDDEVIP